MDLQVQFTWTVLWNFQPFEHFWASNIHKQNQTCNFCPTVLTQTFWPSANFIISLFLIVFKVCMDCVRSYFGTNEPLTSWTLFSSLFFPDQHWSVRKKGFNWSEVHCHRSNFLQNPYFSMSRRLLGIPAVLLYKKFTCTLLYQMILLIHLNT